MSVPTKPVSAFGFASSGHFARVDSQGTWLLHLASFSGHHLCEFAQLAAGVGVSDSSFAFITL